MCTSIYLVVFYILHELTSAYPAQHEAVSNMPSQKVHGLPWWLSGKESVHNAWDAADMGSIPGLGRSPGRGHGNPLQHSWMWVWVNSGSQWWTGRPGVLQFMGSQRVGHDWATELNWTELIHMYKKQRFPFYSFLKKIPLLKHNQNTIITHTHDSKSAISKVILKSKLWAFSIVQYGRVKGHALISCKSTKIVTNCWITIDRRTLEPTKKRYPTPKDKEEATMRW